jgi:hypothetical protein
MSSKYEERKLFLDNIKILVKDEYENIYKILVEYKQNFMKNSNGIFFDVMELSDESFTEINKYMEFCLQNRKEEDSRKKQMDLLRVIHE